jgi:hypothetical protein
LKPPGDTYKNMSFSTDEYIGLRSIRVFDAILDLIIGVG